MFRSLATPYAFTTESGETFVVTRGQLTLPGYKTGPRVHFLDPPEVGRQARFTLKGGKDVRTTTVVVAKADYFEALHMCLKAWNHPEADGGAVKLLDAMRSVKL